VIGKTGRNWPIHAGKDQIHLISASVKSSGTPIDNSTAEDSYTRSRGNSQNVTRDPHASLELFAPRVQTVADPLPPVAARRASAKPPPRDYRDLFAGNDSDQSPAPPVKAVVEESPSPAKPAIVAAKAGAGKNYAPSRLFETDESEQAPPPTEKDHSTEHLYRPNPAKYQHFEFADGSDPQDAPKPAPPVDEVKRSKHGSQWNFDDFATGATRKKKSWIAPSSKSTSSNPARIRKPISNFKTMELLEIAWRPGPGVRVTTLVLVFIRTMLLRKTNVVMLEARTLSAWTPFQM
jgi:hypothetical protein